MGDVILALRFNAMIKLTDLQKVIDGNTVVDIQTLQIGKGEIVALVGPVDSGKETLLELLTGQTRPTAGALHIAEIDPRKEAKAFSLLAGVLFAEENLYKRQSPKANLNFHCRLRRLPKSRAEEVLVQVGLADHADTPVEKLSSSLVRRLAFGRAILHRPQVLLLFEPFAKCDDSSVALLGKVMRQQAEEGVAALILAEDTTNLATVCDTIYRLDQGKIMEAYDPQEELRPSLPFMIPAKLEGKVALVDPMDILYVVAQDDRAFIQTAEDRLPTQFTLSELEKRLSRSGFFRAHRSFLVNLQHVKEVIPYTRDSFSLKLKNAEATEIPLSKSAARELRELLGY